MTTTQPAPSRSALGSDELAGWERDGFHVARGLFSAAEVAAIRDRFDALAAAGTAIEGHWEPDPDATDILGRYPRVMHPHELDPSNMEVFLEPRVHTLVAALMGEDVIGCQTMFYFKPPGARGQAFHQDNYYLLVQPYTCIAAWLAVDRSYAAN